MRQIASKLILLVTLCASSGCLTHVSCPKPVLESIQTTQGGIWIADSDLAELMIYIDCQDRR